MFQEKETDEALVKFVSKHGVGEDDKKAPEFYQTIAQTFGFSKQKVAFIVVPHMVHTLPYFLRALTQIGTIAAIIPKASQYVPSVLESLKEIYEPIICAGNINKSTLKDPEIVRIFLQSICNKYPEHKLMIIDHGGYFAPCLETMQQLFREQIAGIVEHTWNGHLKYQEQLQATPSTIPLYSIARSRLKTYEDEYVASSIIDALSANIMGGAGISQVLSRLKIGVIGYGHMGEAVADELSVRMRSKDSLLICDLVDARLEQAKRSGYKCGKEMAPLLVECHIIIAAASTQILGRTEFNQMKNGACVVCVTSGDDQFKPDYLAGLEKVGETPFVTTYKRPTGESVYLACDGRSVNFSIGSTPHPVLHAVLASVCVAAFSCLATATPATPSSEIKELSDAQVLSIKEIYEDEKRFGSIDKYEVLIKRLKEIAISEIEQDSAIVQGFDLFVSPSATSVDIGKVKDYAKYTYDLDDAVAKFLSTDQNRLLLLQAGAGTSKTLFTRKMEQLLLSNYNPSDPIPLPLFISLPQIKHLDGDLVAQALENKGFNPREIESLKTREFFIILDGFDEIKGKPNLIKELGARYRGKIIVTSRLGYLQDSDDHLFKVDDRENVTKIYITPFDEERVQTYIERYATSPRYNSSGWDVKKYKEVLDKFPELQELIKEPLILQLTLSALPTLEQQQKITRYDIYQAATTNYNRRQIDKLIATKDERLMGSSLDDAIAVIDDYAKELAFTLWRQGEQMTQWQPETIAEPPRKRRYRLRITLADIAQKTDEYSINPYKRLFVSDEEETRRELELGQHGAPVKRLAKYKIMFSHKTFQEFYVAKTMVDALRDLAEIKNSDELIAFIETCELNKKLITLNDRSIVRFICDNIPQCMLALPKEHGQETVSAGASSAAGAAAAAQDAPRELNPSLWLRRPLFGIVHTSKTTNSVSVASANSMTLLNAAKFVFSGMDLRGIKIPGAILVNGIFQFTDLSHADLTDVIFVGCNLVGCNLSQALMDNVTFGEYPILLGHSNKVNCVLIHPDNRTVISASDDKTIRIWNIETAECVKIITGHTEPVRSLDIMPDGIRIISGSNDATIRLWNWIKAECIRSFIGHAAVVRDVAINKKDENIISASQDGTIRLWDSGNGVCKWSASTEPKEGEIKKIVVTFEGTEVVSGSRNGFISMWDIKSGVCLRKFCIGRRFATFVLSPVGKELITAYSDLIQVWDINTLKLLEEVGYIGFHPAKVTRIALMPDGKSIVSARKGEYIVRLQNIPNASGIKVNTYDSGRQTFAGHTGEIKSIAIVPQDARIVSGSDDTTIRIWDDVNHSSLQDLIGHTSFISSLAITLDGAKLITGSVGGTLRIWDVYNGNCLHYFKRSEGPIQTILVNNDSTRIISLSSPDTVCIWDIVHGICLATKNGSAIITTPDGTKTICGHMIGAISIRDNSTGALLQVLKGGHSQSVSSLAVTLCGKKIISGSEDKTIRMWDILSGTSIAVFTGHTSSIKQLVIAVGNKIISKASRDDATIRVWDSANSEHLGILYKDAYKVSSMVITPCGKKIILGYFNEIHIIDIIGNFITKLRGHTDAIKSIIVFPDGKCIASASEDKTICIWDIETGDLRHTIRGHTDKVNTIVVTPDGKRIISAGWDNTIKFWQEIAGCWMLVGNISASGTALNCAAAVIPASLSEGNQRMLMQRGALAEAAAATLRAPLVTQHRLATVARIEEVESGSESITSRKRARNGM